MVPSFFTHPRSNPELKCLYEISLLSYQDHLQDYFLRVIGKVSEYFPTDYSALILHDAGRDFLSVEALYGIQREDHPSGCKRQPGVISKVIETRQPLVIQDPGQEPLYHDLMKNGKGSEKIHPPLPCVPLVANGASVGVLTMNSLYGPREELIEDLQFLSMLSIVLSSVVIDFRSRGFEPLAKDAKSQLKFSVFEESLETRLVEILDKLAPYAESKAQTGIYDDIIAVVEKILIKSALEKVHYVQVSAAQLLGINRNTLHKKMKDLRIKSR